VEHPRVCVIDDSPAIRETIAIVLGAEYRVDCLTPDDCVHNPAALAQADLLIVADDVLRTHGVAALPPNRPILWLQRRSTTPPSVSGPAAALNRTFTPEDLRAHVRDLLTQRTQPPAALVTSTLIDYPMLPQEAARLARRAAATHLPVLICGEPGTGKARLARAIHALSPDSRFLALAAAGCSRGLLQQAAAIAPGDLTVFVGDVDAAPGEVQQLLLELLDCGGLRSEHGWHSVRLICATADAADTLARAAKFDKGLYYRLSVFPITLPPLRDRPQDIRPLAAHLVAELARLLASAPLSLTERALDRLANYLWFGNLAEFETVLTRTAALATSRVIDAGDLLFGYGRIIPHAPPARAEPRGAAAPELASEAESTETVDLIINELAHEFKNPMVTIKTVAQYWERLVGDEAGREQMARLTGDAVDRMDRALENMLQFTRFGSPAPQTASVNALLAPCLTALAPTLTERRLILDYRPPESLLARVDAAQITYAFENLLRVITRELPEGHTLWVHAVATSPAITFAVSGGHRPLGKLVQFLDHPDETETALPLGFVFAKTLIERNGGRMEIEQTTDTFAVTVWLPVTREESAVGNGKTANLDS